MAQPASSHDHGDARHNDGAHSHHIIPVSVLAKVFGALIVLTVLTVITAEYVDLGPLNVPLALAIAGVKATLVVTFFMALRYDNRVNTMVFSVGSIFVVVFLVFTLLDTSYRGDLGNVDTQTIADQERQAEALRRREPDPADLRVAPSDFANEEVPADSASGGGAAASDEGGAETAVTANDESSGNGEAAPDTAATEP